MYTNFALGTTSFFLCFVLTPLCRLFAVRSGLLDKPDQQRKLHTKAVPRIGGLAIMASYAATIFLVVRLAPASEKIYIQHRDLLRVLLPAASLVFLVGLIDDLFTIKAWQKLAGQITGAVLLIVLGNHYAPGLFTIGSGTIPAWISLPLTLILLLACTNAVNLIDGLDGLAAGVGLMATITTLLAGLFTGNSGLVLATMPLAGALLAFLFYNFAPASIYLGDCGSLTIGFLLGCFSLVWSHHNRSAFNLAAPLMVLALPLLDTGLAIVRRYLRNTPIFGADRGHIHHMMQARGFEIKHTALILYAVCAVAASLAMLQSMGSFYIRVAVVVVFSLLVMSGLQYLRYIEFSAALRAIFRRNLVRSMREEIYLEDLERSLSTLSTDEDCWQAILPVVEGLGFSHVELYLHEQYFHSVLNDDKQNCDWSLSLPIGERGYLRLQRPNLNEVPAIAMLVITVLQRCLSKREGTMGGLNRRDAA